MKEKDLEARCRILAAATELLNEEGEIDRITVRQIAERAKVGVGLLNYHFKTKDDLLSLVIGEIMGKLAAGWEVTENPHQLDPTQRLKTMLKELYALGGRYEKLMQFTLRQILLSGDMEAALCLIPVLREIFGPEKEETALRTLALQIILPIQVTALCPVALHGYNGIDLRCPEQRDEFIDALVDNLL